MAAAMRKLVIPALFALCVMLSPPARAERPIPGANRAPFGAQTVWPIIPDSTTIMDRMQGAGIQWGRFDLCWWSVCEYASGQYNFTSAAVPGYTEVWDTDRHIRMLRERGIEPYPILCYSHPAYDGGAGPSTDAGRAAFANYCYAAASRYRDTVTYWEIWKEPNLQHFWGRAADPADYARLVRAAAPRIREANPEAKIIAGVVAPGALGQIDFAFLNPAFDAGLLDDVDVISVHPYRSGSPESVNAEYATLRSAIASRTQRPIAIWSGEWGYNTAWSGITDTAQAKCLSRMIVNNLSQGIELSIWFSTHPFAEDATQPENPQWGLVDYQYNPRPAWYAMRALNQRLPAPVRHVAAPFGAVLSPSLSNSRLEFFERGDSRHLTLAVWLARWPARDSFTGSLSNRYLATPGGTQFQAFDGLTGNPVTLSVSRAGDQAILANLRVMDYPLFIEITLPPPPRNGLIVR